MLCMGTKQSIYKNSIIRFIFVLYTYVYTLKTLKMFICVNTAIKGIGIEYMQGYTGEYLLFI